MTTLDEIADSFELLGDWEQRYAYFIELGEQIPAMPELEKTDDNKVKGCMSQVWTCAVPDPQTFDSQQRRIISYHGDCDTSIIKGVLALLLELTSGKTVAEVEQLDVDEFFERLNLHEHLSPNRHFGIYSIVDQMKKQARELTPSISNVA
ncbi:MAG: SufE family protein [Gammaproteobacteria bacterium]|nr:SufE family protein [Gammaproteobacteria bacterium]